MRRIAAMALAAVVLLALASPAFAGWGNDEFYPGDKPPYAASASGGQSTAVIESADSAADIGADGTVTEDGPANKEFPGEGYNPPGKGDGK